MRYFVLVEHNLKGGSWERFETVFKKDTERRKSLGCISGRVLRDLRNPDNVLVILEWENKEGALAFVTADQTERAFLWATSSASSKAHAAEEVFVTDS